MSPAATRLASWRLALRLARREALRSRARSILAVVMIALPVLAVTAADVVLQTQHVSAGESSDRRLGTAVAQVSVPSAGRPLAQAFDPDQGYMPVGKKPAAAPTVAQLAAALDGARMLPVQPGGVDVRTDAGVGWVEAIEVDLSDPLAAGLFRLTSGHLPDAPGEVVVNQALLDKGYAVGDRLDLEGLEGPEGPEGQGAPEPTIVGVAESAEVRSYPVAAGPLGSLGLVDARGASRTWLVGGEPVGWETVRELNALGALVVSRAVLEDPPPRSALPPEIQAWGNGGTDDATIAVAVLVVVMALLEVVLLAGPAFAVGARRQARSLALMAASGGTPGQARRVVLASGVVLGAVAAAVGVVAGIGLGIVLNPIVQRWSSTWFGPVEIPWLHLLGVAGFGMLSALLAAVVPAWIASRQDVVAVLAGRRADRPPSLRSPVLGVVLLAVGIAGAAYGAAASQNGAYFIAGAAVVSVAGMILLVPLVVVLVARVAGRLPLPVRYAARDAARHRTRTVPAVAAVAATVAGVVTLGIALSSDEAENAGTYAASLPVGTASVTDSQARPDWPALRAAVAQSLPAASVVELDGAAQVADGDRWLDVTVSRGGDDLWLDYAGGGYGAAVLVDDGDRLSALPQVGVDEVDDAAAVLASGGAVVFTSDEQVGQGDVRLTATAMSRRGKVVATEHVTVPAYVVHVGSREVAPRAVLPPEVADRLGLETVTVSLLVADADVSDRQETDLSEAVTAISESAGLYVERGYEAPEETVIIQLVLGALGAVLMLGGTLTATFLALSDARPDLATLSAIGASPRRRRGIAAGYALVVGLVGALLGAAVGFIPGIAITYPLTSPASSDAGPFLDVPWLLIGALVLGLPILTALIVGLAARSRLPLVSRSG